MKKVTIYTLADKRPDFIELQYKTFKQYIKDDYEYVVLNNAISSRKHRNEIRAICENLGITCVDVKKDKTFNTIAGETAISWWGSYVNANLACAYPLKWVWPEVCKNDKDNLAVIIDSDMFLCKPISFNDELGEKDAAFIIQYRGPQKERTEALVAYPWNGICIFNVEKIPDLVNLSWDCGVVEGFPVDVGGQSHYWMKKNNISLRHISEYAIHKHKQVDDTTIWLEATLNGNYHYSFNYNTHTKAVNNFHCYEKEWVSTDAVLPHFPKDFQPTLEQKTIRYYERFVQNKQTYPDPAFLGLIEFESFENTMDPFIIHNKAGSGYMGFDKEYGKLKLAFIKETLRL